MHRPHFIYLSVNRHLGCFYLLSFMNSVQFFQHVLDVPNVGIKPTQSMKATAKYVLEIPSNYQNSTSVKCMQVNYAFPYRN